MDIRLVRKSNLDKIKQGIIEPAQSAWSSNVVMARKKDGSLRFCVDYRKLNELTVKDTYPLPLIQSCLDAVGKAKWFSTFDLRSGYHQVVMEQKDADKTTCLKTEDVSLPGNAIRVMQRPRHFSAPNGRCHVRFEFRGMSRVSG